MGEAQITGMKEKYQRAERLIRSQRQAKHMMYLEETGSLKFKTMHVD